MTRTFELHAESSASVAQTHSAFGDAGYWTARLAEGTGGTATLEDLSVGADGTVDVSTRVNLRHDGLPGLVAPLVPGDLELAHTETWRWAGDGGLRGEVGYAVRGGQLSVRGVIMLTPQPAGTRQHCTVATHARIPVVGRAIERLVCATLRGGILATQRFTTDWIDRHG
jgi:hypothetical protein